MRWAALAFFVAAILAAAVEQRPHAQVVSSATVPGARPNTPVPWIRGGGVAAGHHVAPMAAATGPDVIAIPVAGVRREALRDMFNDARTGHSHHAIDILAPRQTPVVAAVDGQIRKLFSSGAGGLTIYESDPADEKIYYYAHLDHYASIAEGMNVKRGDIVGYVGTTGNAPPETPHLHFAVFVLPPTKEWWKGEAIDPYPMLMRDGVTVEVTP
ncbi:MAG: M23 family metallopeptidase [Acidobacteriota bacterium]